MLVLTVAPSGLEKNAIAFPVFDQDMLAGAPGNGDQLGIVGLQAPSLFPNPLTGAAQTRIWDCAAEGRSNAEQVIRREFRNAGRVFDFTEPFICRPADIAIRNLDCLCPETDV